MVENERARETYMKQEVQNYYVQMIVRGTALEPSITPRNETTSSIANDTSEKEVG